MKGWKKRFQEFWMYTDNKPKGRDLRYVNKQNRQDAKREIQRQIEEDEEYGSDTEQKECDNCNNCKLHRCDC